MATIDPLAESKIRKESRTAKKAGSATKSAPASTPVTSAPSVPVKAPSLAKVKSNAKAKASETGHSTGYEYKAGAPRTPGPGETKPARKMGNDVAVRSDKQPMPKAGHAESTPESAHFGSKVQPHRPIGDKRASSTDNTGIGYSAHDLAQGQNTNGPKIPAPNTSIPSVAKANPAPAAKTAKASASTTKHPMAGMMPKMPAAKPADKHPMAGMMPTKSATKSATKAAPSQASPARSTTSPHAQYSVPNPVSYEPPTGPMPALGGRAPEAKHTPNRNVSTAQFGTAGNNSPKSSAPAASSSKASKPSSAEGYITRTRNRAKMSTDLDARRDAARPQSKAAQLVGAPSRADKLGPVGYGARKAAVSIGQGIDDSRLKRQSKKIGKTSKGPSSNPMIAGLGSVKEAGSVAKSVGKAVGKVAKPAAKAAYSTMVEGTKGIAKAEVTGVKQIAARVKNERAMAAVKVKPGRAPEGKSNPSRNISPDQFKLGNPFK